MREVQDWAGYQVDRPSTAGIDAAIIKATEGLTFINSKQSTQTATARTAGLAVGFYHFQRDNDPEKEASFFVTKCLSLQGDSLWCDWEDTSVSCAEKDAFLKEVKRLRPDHFVGLYCNLNFWFHHDTTSYAGDGLWIADPSAPKGKPRIQNAWLLHQYGIKNNTDLNVIDLGSRQAIKDTWNKFVVKTPTKPTPPAKPTPSKPTKPPVKVPPKPKIPAFPGVKHFVLGKSDPAVTTLGKQLVKKGYTHHNDGHHGYNPGPRFTKYDQANLRDFQLAHKELKGDADGYPGPLTWRLLFS